MKTPAAALLTTIWASCLGWSVSAQEACSLSVRNESGATVGRVESDGDIRDAGGALIGRLRNGTVRDRSGALKGRIDTSGSIRDRSGATIGKVDHDGDLRDRSGTYIGKIEDDGDVRNRGGALAGKIGGYSPACRLSVAAYLFFFEPLHAR
jgi:hypothetical protein